MCLIFMLTKIITHEHKWRDMTEKHWLSPAGDCGCDICVLMFCGPEHTSSSSSGLLSSAQWGLKSLTVEMFSERLSIVMVSQQTSAFWMFLWYSCLVIYLYYICKSALMSLTSYCVQCLGSLCSAVSFLPDVQWSVSVDTVGSERFWTWLLKRSCWWPPGVALCSHFTGLKLSWWTRRWGLETHC